MVTVTLRPSTCATFAAGTTSAPDCTLSASSNLDTNPVRMPRSLKYRMSPFTPSMENR